VGLSQTLLLGFIAGATIVFGLPVGRLQRPAPVLRAILNALATGILLFLVWDVVTHAWDPIDSALSNIHDHAGGLAPVFGYGALFAAGLTAGLGSLVAYEMWMGKRTARATAIAVLERDNAPGPAQASLWQVSGWSPARRLALIIATGIGLHNFAEGLAIGQSAARGELALATLLVIGFGLHNATEGFGIVAPLAGGAVASGSTVISGSTVDANNQGVAQAPRPSWGFLLLLGLIGGGPTFLGTAVGHSFTSEPVSVVFLTLAAGSILYVVIQLLGVAAKTRRPDLLAIGLLIGLILGFATDAIVTAAGA
jgi:ZIP family zinc transporter